MLIRPKITANYFQLTPSYDRLTRYTENLLYRHDVAVISGGFLGGNSAALARFHAAFHWKVLELVLQRGMVDDDQTTLTLCINTEPELFNPVHGDWHDAFRLF